MEEKNLTWVKIRIGLRMSELLPLKPFIYVFAQAVEMVTHALRPVFQDIMQITNMDPLTSKRLL